MGISDEIVTTTMKFPVLYKLLILPYYFLRFLFHSILTCSWWFYRYPPGHYGSTIPSARDIDVNQATIFTGQSIAEDGIGLSEHAQLERLDTFAGYYKDYDFPEHKTEDRRYYYGNKMFGFNDGFTLYSFLRDQPPANIVEIGSGFSSALMLDLSDEILKETKFTFIEPRPATLKGLMRATDKHKVTIIPNMIQDVSLSLFDHLGEGDLLFVDSSHVIKIGSDLSTIFYSILPRLKPGVVVHIHDIYWPFEYPKAMLDEGRNWNEIYFTRSFLQFNRAFEILYFTSYLEHKYREMIEDKMPGYFKCTGKSLWLRKMA